MISSTSSSESQDGALQATGKVYGCDDPSVLWLPQGPDRHGCPAHKDPGAIALFVSLFFVFIIAFLRPGASTAAKDPAGYWMAKAQWVRKSPIVIAGDSRAFIGVSPSSFESELGIPAVNAGFSSAKLTSPYLEYIRGVVDVSADDPTIIFGVSPFSFTNRRSEGTGYLTAVKRNSSSTSSIEMILRHTVSGLDPLSMKHLLFLVFKRFGHADILSMQSPLQGVLEHEYRPDGWVAVTAREFPADSDSRRIQEITELRKRIENDPENISAFCEFIASCRSDGVRVILFRLPVSKRVADYEENLFDVDFDQLRHSFEFSGGVWISVPDSLDLKTYDGSHLERASAVKLSEELAKMIRGLDSP